MNTIVYLNHWTGSGPAALTGGEAPPAIAEPLYALHRLELATVRALLVPANTDQRYLLSQQARLEAWLLGHPRFGPALRDWRLHGAIAPRAKRAALVGMTAGFALFWLLARPGWPLALGVLALMGVGAGYVLTRPGGAPEA